MATRMMPVQVGDLDLLIETTIVPGAESTTSGLGKAGDKVLSAFDAAQDAIVEMAVKLAGSVQAMGRRAVHPKEVQVEFGLCFGSNGGIIIAGASIEGSFKVTITYDRDQQETNPASAGGSGQT